MDWRHLLLLVVCLAACCSANQPIPNPFLANHNQFTIQYRQCIELKNTNEPKQCHMVEEWLSLSAGLSFSRFRDAANNEAVFSLLADGSSQRFYLIQYGRNRELSRCLPDQWHLHRQLFPWRATEGNLHGVAAIWLNAIQKKLTSSDSVWRMQSDRQSVKLRKTNEHELDIEILERSLYSRTRDNQKVTVYGDRIVSIEIQSLSPSESSLAAEVVSLLRKCQEKTKLIKLMPSLSVSLATLESPLYALQYVKWHLTADRPIVLVKEKFDYTRRSQLTSLSVLNQKSDKPVIENVFHLQLNQDSCLEHHYMKKDGQVSHCWRNRLTKPRVSGFEETIRRVQFVAERVPVDGWTEGVGALLMNAGDILAEDMQTFREIIHVPSDPLDTNSMCTVGHSTIVWRWLKADREFSFYFKIGTDMQSDSPKIENLIRVELREKKSLTRYDIRSFTTGPVDAEEQFTLPNLCLSAPIISDEQSGVKFPSFYEFVGRTNAYLASYAVQRTDPNHELIRVKICEELNASSKQSKFVLTNEDQFGFISEIYADGASGLVFKYEPEVTHFCTRISTLAQLVDFKDLELDEASLDEHLHGVARLWVQLMHLGDYQLESKEEGQQIYRLDKTNSDGSRTKVEVQFYLNSDQVHQLERISVVHENSHNQTERVDVLMETMNLVNKDDAIRLPENCEALKAKLDNELHVSSNTSDDRRGFPKLSSLLKSAKGRFYLRSEIICPVSVIDDSECSYLLDEWVLEKDFRLTSSGLSHNLDLLIYGTTGELFDLSVPYECPIVLPSILGSSGEKLSHFFAFLGDQLTVANKLVDLYYSPLLLWLLAEKSSSLIKLDKMFFLIPQPDKLKLDQQEANLELEMSEEVWQVESPAGAKSYWKYRMHFTKMAQLAGKSEFKGEEQFLSKIEIIMDGKLALIRRNPVINIINMRQNFRSQHELAEKFRIPEGYNCWRKKGIDKGDSGSFNMNVDSKELQQLHYEAWLEALAENSDDKWLSLPNLSGVFTPPSGLLQIAVHRARSRSPTGEWQSHRLVHENNNQQMYRLDQTSGHCAVNKAVRNLWQLQFSPNITIELDNDLIQTLFATKPKEEFHLINRYVSEGLLFSVYERKVDNFMLFTDGHSSSASLIHVYKRNETLKSREITEISVKVLLFDERPRRIKRRFGIVLRRKEIQMTDLVRETNVVQCYNEANWILDRRIASFELEYQLKKGDGPTAETMQMAFVKTLLHSWNLSPLQLAQLPRVELSNSGRQASVQFELIDGPTAAKRFTRMFSTRMTPELESKALVRTVTSLADCSFWCDQLGPNCQAMSFCADRSCYLLTLNILARHKFSPAESMIDEHCVHFYSMFSRGSVTVEQMANSLEMAVNVYRTPSELAKFTINMTSGSQLEPSRFVQLQKGIESSLAPGSSSFTLYKSNRWLDATKLANDANQQFETALELGECLAKCADCPLVAFCKQAGDCATIGLDWLESQDVKQLTSSLEVERASCSVYTRNHLVEYDLFKDTQPQSAAAIQRLDGYSELECSAVCSQLDDTCRSFDLCATLDNEKEETTVCLLLSEHVSFGSFNRSCLVGSTSDLCRKIEDISVTCNHYSRSLLASYKRIANLRLNDATGGLAVRGSSVEQCAAECRQDEQCIAFEHCLSLDSEPAQSCTFSTDRLTANKLEPSNDCSVYLWREPMTQIEASSSPAASPEEDSCNLWAIAALLVVVLILSSSLQIIYIRLSGGRRISLLIK